MNLWVQVSVLGSLAGSLGGRTAQRLFSVACALQSCGRTPTLRPTVTVKSRQLQSCVVAGQHGFLRDGLFWSAMLSPIRGRPRQQTDHPLHPRLARGTCGWVRVGERLPRMQSCRHG